MQQVGRVRSATQAAAAPLVQKASDGVRALLKLVSSSESGYFNEGDIQATEIKQQLSSFNTETKLIGLRRAIAAEAACGTGEYTEGPSLFFADVLKNLSTCDFELKRLVYLYLVQHAQQHPDLTLLSVNGYQKDIYSSSHVVRAAALKSLSSLCMLEIVQLLIHSLKRAAADTSPLVRKTAAHAAAKIYYLDTDQREEIVGVLLQLLGDGEIAVFGAALISFRLIFFQSPHTGPTSPGAPSINGVSPHGTAETEERTYRVSSDSQEEALALLHPFYSRLVALLPQLQSGPQVVAVDLLTRYCRCFFRQPQPLEVGPQGGSSPQGKVEEEDTPEDHTTEATSSSSSRGQPRMPTFAVLVSRGPGSQPQRAPQPGVSGAPSKRYGPLPEDFEAFRQALELLLFSDSVAVVVSACSAIQSLFPSTSWDCVVHPLLRCLYICPSDYKEPLLKIITSFVSLCPRLFQPHMREFYLKQSDTFPVRQQKLQLLFSLTLAFPASLSALLPELRVYLQWAGDEGLIASVFRVLTLLALRYKQAHIYCMRLFVSLLDSGCPSVAAEAVVGVRTLVQQKQEEQDGDMLARLVLHLAAQLSKVTSPAARASVVWVVGKYHAQVSWVAADALRQLTKRFREEAEEVKLQILLLAVRLWGFHLRNMQEGPLGDPTSETSPEGGQQDGEQRLIPRPTREQSRQHFPRLDAMLGFLYEMALYDTSHDVRDMGRIYSALTSVLSRPETDLPEDQKDMRRFAALYLDSLSASAPTSSSSETSLLLGGEEAILGWDKVLASAREAGRPWSSLAFHTGLSFPGDVPLPSFASVDSAASLRCCLNEDEALRQNLLSFSLRPRQGGPGTTSPTAHGPRSICSADVIRQENAASLMGRIDGGKAPISQIDLDSFYENDPVADLAHLNGTTSSANSTECTGTRSTGVGAGEVGGSDNNNEAMWAAFETGGDAAGGPDGDLVMTGNPPAGLIVGEDEESEEEGTSPPNCPLQQQAPSTSPSPAIHQTLQAEENSDWNFSPPVA